MENVDAKRLAAGYHKGRKGHVASLRDAARTLRIQNSRIRLGKF
ncbi:MAG: hypothetical protein V7L29_22515 [Nostoc sp.]